MYFTRIWYSLFHTASLQTHLADNVASSHKVGFPTFAFSETWEVLGPFQIGTREAQWGADPLEYYGGFRDLDYDQSATFRSSLAFNGTVSWSNRTATLSDPDEFIADAYLNVDFPDIGWAALRDVYGWAALQWQAWARGAIIVQSDNTNVLGLSMENILELWVDDEHYFGGDFYGYKRAPISLYLEPGIHRIDVRLVRDVRAMGGVGSPNVGVNLKLQKSDGYLQPILRPGLGGVLISDFIGDRKEGALASPYASIVVRNDARRDAHIHAIEPTHNACLAELLSKDPIKLAPGQSRPIPFRIACIVPIESSPLYGRILVDVKGSIDGEDDVRIASFAAYPRVRSAHEPHKVTFLHPGGIVSYAILRAPSAKACSGLSTDEHLPVFLGLHGAGLEADNDIVRHALDPIPDLSAWVVLPTGVTPWSGDDWHVWGFSDVEAAVAAIPDWIRQVKWGGPGVDTDKWLVSGHSNGGQGTWYALTHCPDKVIAAAPISGYSSIQNYVPYTWWLPSDPGRTAVVQSALLSYKHELLLANAKGIPILQQHGGDDDNVPPYHSRLMSQMIPVAGAASTYLEVPDQPHWWDGVMTTSPLKAFYSENLRHRASHRPANLQDFTLITANPGDTGTKHGLQILQLIVPGQLGKIEVIIDPFTGSCSLKPSNVGVFQMPTALWDCSLVRLHNQEIVTKTAVENLTFTLVDDRWHVRDEIPESWPRPILRRGRQLGAMDAILTTHGAFQIVRHSEGTEDVALQISRNLCQYFAADTEISDDWDTAISKDGNIISVAIGDDLPESYTKVFPIQWRKPYLVALTPDDRERVYIDVPGLGLAAIYLRPLPLGRLELVVWGADKASLALAARLVPMMTGTGQPDFVIADRQMLEKGLEGALALGFFDQIWAVSVNSYFS